MESALLVGIAAAATLVYLCVGVALYRIQCLMCTALYLLLPFAEEVGLMDMPKPSWRETVISIFTLPYLLAKDFFVKKEKQGRQTK